VALDDMYSEHVPPRMFVTEAQQLLDDSLAGNAALRQALTEHDWCALWSCCLLAMFPRCLRSADVRRIIPDPNLRYYLRSAGQARTIGGSRWSPSSEKGRRPAQTCRRCCRWRCRRPRGLTVASHDPAKGHLAYPR